MSEKIDEKDIVAKYTPYVAVTPDKYSKKQYLYDNNALLTEINDNLKFLIQFLISEKDNQENKEEKKQVNVIGSKNV